MDQLKSLSDPVTLLTDEVCKGELAQVVERSLSM